MFDLMCEVGCTSVRVCRNLCNLNSTQLAAVLLCTFIKTNSNHTVFIDIIHRIPLVTFILLWDTLAEKAGCTRTTNECTLTRCLDVLILVETSDEFHFRRLWALFASTKGSDCPQAPMSVTMYLRSVIWFQTWLKNYIWQSKVT